MADTELNTNRKLRAEVERLRQRVEELEKELHFQACLTKDLMPYQERAVNAEQELAEFRKDREAIAELCAVLKDHMKRMQHEP